MIRTEKYHISLNILALNDEERLTRFSHGLHLFQEWLKIFVFKDETVDSQNFALAEDGIFLSIIEANDYFEKFRDIYDKILYSKDVYDENGLHFYVTGVNHFSQAVIFLDFEDDSNKNSLLLALLKMIHEMIQKLCKAYKIKCDKKGLNAHCTLMKISKMKKNESKILLNYNKDNDIRNSSKRGKNGYKVYDINGMEIFMNKDNIENKINNLGDCNHQLVTHIDLCQMTAVQDDGYYKIVQNFRIIP